MYSRQTPLWANVYHSYQTSSIFERQARKVREATVRTTLKKVNSTTYLSLFNEILTNAKGKDKPFFKQYIVGKITNNQIDSFLTSVDRMLEYIKSLFIDQTIEVKISVADIKPFSPSQIGNDRPTYEKRGRKIDIFDLRKEIEAFIKSRKEWYDKRNNSNVAADSGLVVPQPKPTKKKSLPKQRKKKTVQRPLTVEESNKLRMLEAESIKHYVDTKDNSICSSIDGRVGKIVDSQYVTYEQDKKTKHYYRVSGEFADSNILITEEGDALIRHTLKAPDRRETYDRFGSVHSYRFDNVGEKVRLTGSNPEQCQTVTSEETAQVQRNAITLDPRPKSESSIIKDIEKANVLSDEMENAYKDWTKHIWRQKDLHPKLLQMNVLLHASNEDIVIAHKPGAGKTVNSVLLAEMKRNAAIKLDPKNKALRILVVAPKTQLLQQWQDTVIEWGFNPGNWAFQTVAHFRMSLLSSNYSDYNDLGDEVKNNFRKNMWVWSDDKKQFVFQPPDASTTKTMDVTKWVFDAGDNYPRQSRKNIQRMTQTWVMDVVHHKYVQHKKLLERIAEKRAYMSKEMFNYFFEDRNSNKRIEEHKDSLIFAIDDDKKEIHVLADLMWTEDGPIPLTFEDQTKAFVKKHTKWLEDFRRKIDVCLMKKYGRRGKVLDTPFELSDGYGMDGVIDISSINTLRLFLKQIEPFDKDITEKRWVRRNPLGTVRTYVKEKTHGPRLSCHLYNMEKKCIFILDEAHETVSNSNILTNRLLFDFCRFTHSNILVTATPLMSANYRQKLIMFSKLLNRQKSDYDFLTELNESVPEASQSSERFRIALSKLNNKITRAFTKSAVERDRFIDSLGEDFFSPVIGPDIYQTRANEIINSTEADEDKAKNFTEAIQSLIDLPHNELLRNKYGVWETNLKNMSLKELGKVYVMLSQSKRIADRLDAYPNHEFVQAKLSDWKEQLIHGHSAIRTEIDAIYNMLPERESAVDKLMRQFMHNNPVKWNMFYSSKSEYGIKSDYKVAMAKTAMETLIRLEEGQIEVDPNTDVALINYSLYDILDKRLNRFPTKAPLYNANFVGRPGYYQIEMDEPMKKVQYGMNITLDYARRYTGSGSNLDRIYFFKSASEALRQNFPDKPEFVPLIVAMNIEVSYEKDIPEDAILETYTTKTLRHWCKIYKLGTSGRKKQLLDKLIARRAENRKQCKPIDEECEQAMGMLQDYAYRYSYEKDCLMLPILVNENIVNPLALVDLDNPDIHSIEYWKDLLYYCFPPGDPNHVNDNDIIRLSKDQIVRRLKNYDHEKSLEEDDELNERVQVEARQHLTKFLLEKYDSANPTAPAANYNRATRRSERTDAFTNKHSTRADYLAQCEKEYSKKDVEDRLTWKHLREGNLDNENTLAYVPDVLSSKVQKIVTFIEQQVAEDKNVIVYDASIEVLKAIENGLLMRKNNKLNLFTKKTNGSSVYEDIGNDTIRLREDLLNNFKSNKYKKWKKWDEAYRKRDKAFMLNELPYTTTTIPARLAYDKSPIKQEAADGETQLFNAAMVHAFESLDTDDTNMNHHLGLMTESSMDEKVEFIKKVYKSKIEWCKRLKNPAYRPNKEGQWLTVDDEYYTESLYENTDGEKQGITIASKYDYAYYMVDPFIKMKVKSKTRGLGSGSAYFKEYSVELRKEGVTRGKSNLMKALAYMKSYRIYFEAIDLTVEYDISSYIDLAILMSKRLYAVKSIQNAYRDVLKKDIHSISKQLNKCENEKRYPKFVDAAKAFFVYQVKKILDKESPLLTKDIRDNIVSSNGANVLMYVSQDHNDANEVGEFPSETFMSWIVNSKKSSEMFTSTNDLATFVASLRISFNEKLRRKLKAVDEELLELFPWGEYPKETNLPTNISEVVSWAQMVLGNLFKQRKLEFLATLGAKKTELTLSDRDRNIWFSAGEKEQMKTIQTTFLEKAKTKLKHIMSILKAIENAEEKQQDIQSELTKIYDENKDMKHAWAKCRVTKKILKRIKKQFKSILKSGETVWNIDVRDYLEPSKEVDGPEQMDELDHVFKALLNIAFDPVTGQLSDGIFDLYGEDFSEFKMVYNDIYGSCDEHFSKAIDILQRRRESLERQLDLASNSEERLIESHKEKTRLEEGISAMTTSAKNFKIEMIKYIVDNSEYIEKMVGFNIDGSDDLTDIPPRFHIVKKYMASTKIAYLKTSDKALNESLKYETYKHESDERLLGMLDEVEDNPEWGNHKHNLLINKQEYLDDVVKVVSYSRGTDAVTRQGIIVEQVPPFQQEGTVVKLLSGKVRVRIGDKENIYPKSKIKETKLVVGDECTVTQDDYWKVKFDGTNMEKNISRKDMQGLNAKTKIKAGKKVTIKFEDESKFYKGKGETTKYKNVFPRPIIHPNTQERLEMFKKDANGEDVLEQGLKGTYLDTRGKDSIKAVRNRVSGMIDNKVRFGILTAKDAPGAPKRDVYKAAFECGLIDCLLMNRSSITGIDFTSSKESVCIMISPTQLGIADQFVGRLVRRNSHEVCPPEFRRVQHVSFTSVWNRGVNEFPNSPEDESDTHFERNNRRAQNSSYGRDDSYIEEKDAYRTGADNSFVVGDDTIEYEDGASPDTEDDNLPSASDTDSDSDDDSVADEMEKQFAGQAYNLRKEKSIGKLYAKDDDYTPDSDGDSSDDDYDATTVRNTQKKIARQKQVVRKKRKKEELWVKVTREEVDEKTGEKRTITEYVRKEKEIKPTSKRVRNPDKPTNLFMDDCDRDWNPEDDIGGVNARLGVYLNFNALARYKSHLFYTVYDALKSDYQQQYGFRTLDTYWENNSLPPSKVPENVADKFWYKDVVQNEKGEWEASNKRESDLQADSVIMDRPASGELLNLHRGFNPDVFNKDLIQFGYTCYVCHTENGDADTVCKNCGAELKLRNGSPNYYKMEMCRELKLVDGIDAERYTLEKNKATISKNKDTERNRIYMDLALLSVEHNANKKGDKLFRFEIEDYTEPRQTITYFQRVTDKDYQDPNLATRDKSDLDIITMSDVSIPDNIVPDGVVQTPEIDPEPDIDEPFDPSVFFGDDYVDTGNIRLGTSSMASVFGFKATPVNDTNNPSTKFTLKNVIGDGNCLYYAFLQSLSEVYRKNRSLIPQEFKNSNNEFMYNIDWEENVDLQHKKVTSLRVKLSFWFSTNMDNRAFDAIPSVRLPNSNIRTKTEVLESIKAGIGSSVPLKGWGDTDIVVILMEYFQLKKSDIGVNIFNRDEKRWDVNNHSDNLNEAPSKYNIYLWYVHGNHYKWLQCLSDSCVLDIESDYDSDI